MFRAILSSIFLFLILVNVCAAAGQQPIQTKASKPAQAAKMDSMLYQLTQAEDPEAFARQRDIPLVNDRVRVVIELHEGSDLVVGPEIAVEATYRNLVRALVPIGRVLSISQQEDVKFVRLPQKLVPAHD